MHHFPDMQYDNSTASRTEGGSLHDSGAYNAASSASGAAILPGPVKR
ncbi:hypothetical protein [uncultured Chryseobacterium sp.]|nr:hypothetical protein [uncultured Chryseobacterium sp.]